jgi:hypothetical protein
MVVRVPEDVVLGPVRTAGQSVLLQEFVSSRFSRVFPAIPCHGNAASFECWEAQSQTEGPRFPIH